MSNYYKFDEKFEGNLDKLRGYFIVLTTDDHDGNEVVLTGVLIRTKKGVFMVSEGTIERPELRPFSVGRIKSMRINGTTFTPKQKEKVTENDAK